MTKEDDTNLWNSGVMGLTRAKTLENAAFCVVSRMFALRGGIEHWSLKLSQVKRMKNPDHYMYYENNIISKNRNGSFKQIQIKRKVVPIFACPEAGERCPIYIVDKYISKLPPLAVATDLFYVRPLQGVPTDLSAPWYAAVPVRRDTLNKKFHLMYEH